MSSHSPIIIPEINEISDICDYREQTVRILNQKKIPTYTHFLNIFSQNFDNTSYSASTKFLPFNRFPFIQQINKYLSLFCLYIKVTIKHRSVPVLWIYYPSLVGIIKYLPFPKKIVYDIVDFYSSPDPEINNTLRQQKKYLLQKSQLITAISQSLIESYKKIFPSAPIYLVPQGYNLIKNKKKLSAKILNISKTHPKIGYIGAINNRLDFKLLLNLISDTPRYSYIFVGPVSKDNNVQSKPLIALTTKLFTLPNAFHIDKVEKTKISSWIEFFDICIIPYDTKDEFNRLCYPMKLFEYFACGKPVLSTSITELKRFPNLVYIGNSAGSWKKHLKKLISQPWPKDKQAKANNLAQKNSWGNKVDEVLKLMS